MDLLTKGTQLQKLKKVDIYLRIGTFSPKKKSWMNSFIHLITRNYPKKGNDRNIFQGQVLWWKIEKMRNYLPTIYIHSSFLSSCQFKRIKKTMPNVSGDNRQDVLKKDQSHNVHKILITKFLREFSCYTIWVLNMILILYM